MFWAMFLPIIKSTWLYLQYLIVFTQVAADRQLKLFGQNISSIFMKVTKKMQLYRLIYYS